MTTSARTIVRDAILAAFVQAKQSGAVRMSDFATSLRWLTEQETTQKNTYSLIVTDEQRTPDTLSKDRYDMTAVVVIYAYDSRDPRAALDAMIEDAIDICLRAERTMQPLTMKMHLESIATDEGTTAAGPWAQAVLRWTVVHYRAASMI